MISSGFGMLPFGMKPFGMDPFGVARFGMVTGETSLGPVYLETFPATSAVDSGFYGKQSSVIYKVNKSTGEQVATTYLEMVHSGPDDHYNFLRDGIVHNGILIVGQSKLGADAQGTEIHLMTMSTDLSTVYDRYAFGDTTDGDNDGQPALVAHGDNVWCAFACNGAITASSGGGYDDTHSGLDAGGGDFSRVVICKFLINSDKTLTLLNHTYVQSTTPTAGFGIIQMETHGLARFSNGDIIWAGEAGRGANFVATSGAYDETVPLTGAANRKGIWAIFSEDLGTLKYASYFGGTSSGNDIFFDGVTVDSNDNYAFAGTTASDSNETTDGSTKTALSGDAGMLIVFDSGNNLIYSTYCSQPVGSGSSPARRCIFDNDDNLLIGGWQAASSPTRTEPYLKKYSIVADPYFSRAVSVDATFASPTATTLGLSTKLTFEVKATFGLEANLTLFDTTGSTSNAKVVLTYSGVGTPLTVFLSMDGTPGTSPGANKIVAGTEYTMRFMWDGPKGEARCYIQGGIYSSDTFLVADTGNSTSWTIAGSDTLVFFTGITSSLTSVKHLKVWYDVESDWSLPATTPDMTIDYSNANSTSWKSGASDFAISDLYGSTWSSQIAVTTSGNGQTRDIDVDTDGNIYIVGGISNYTSTPDYLYIASGGTSGSGAVLKGFAAKFNSSGTRQWFSINGSVGSYHRYYASALDTNYLYCFGRGGDTMLVGRDLQTKILLNIDGTPILNTDGSNILNTNY